MKNISVSVFINILFALVLTLIFTALFLFIQIDKEQQKKEEINRQKRIANFFLSTAQLNVTKEKLAGLNLRLVSNNELQLLELTKGKVIFESSSPFGRLHIFTLEKNKYISLQRYGLTLMLQDQLKTDNRIQTIILATLLVTFLFLFLYIGIYRKIAPLKKLNRQIEEFANGNMNIKITQKSNDEIGKIAQSFDNAIHHIRVLLESKHLFMRNMMHELKTPITRGRIAIEMVEDGTSKEVLIRAFERMTELINELAHVERLTTEGFQPHLNVANINDIIEESVSLLLWDKENLTIQTENEQLNTDPKLLSLAIKNLLDNAMKYSTDKKATIITNKESIKILSKGRSLEHPLEYYLEPFTQEEKRNSGFGLGLYIVNNIAKRLGYTLHYSHKNDYNIFELKLNKTK